MCKAKLGLSEIVSFVIVVALTSANLSCGKNKNSSSREGSSSATSENQSIQGDASRLSHPFPSVLLKDLTDKVVPTDQILAGKNTVVLFISPTCSPCSDEIKRWKSVVPTLLPPFQVIGISADPVAELALYVKEQQINFSTYSDPSEALIEYFKISTYPTIVGVTPEKIVKFIRPGYSGSLNPSQYLQTF
jgi:peroxiredoxin